MKNTERQGVDIEVALSSLAKPVFSIPNVTATAACEKGLRDTAIVQDLQQDPAAPVAQIGGSVRPGLKATAKQLARPVARALYRLLKPLLRPIAFRVRAYLTEPLRLELLLLREAAEGSLQQVRSGFDANRESLALATSRIDAAMESGLTLAASRIEAAVERALAVHTLQNVQEIQAARDSLRRRLANIAADQDSLRATIAADQKRLEHLPTQLARIEAYGYAAARRIAVPCGPDELLVRTLVGYVLCPGSDHALLSSLIEAGELEPGTRGLIQRLLSPGNVFIDVGANIGMHTLAAAIAMGGKGRIVAFEPFAQTHGLLQKTIWMNGFSEIAEVHQAAVSDRQGSQMLFLGATSGHHSLYQLQPAILPVPPPVEVALVRLDDVLRGAAHVDLIKIDVEGAELDVLSGAGLTISNNKDIGLIVEFGFSHLKRSGQLTQDWLGAFERFGLDVGVINSETGVLESWTREQLEAAPSVNLFFARPGSKTWNRAWGTP